jgi:predicted dehydrogenase
MRVGIVGCGLIGGKRAAALSRDQLVAVCDREPARAQALAARHPGAAAVTLDELLARSEAVIVATTNDHLAAVTRQALEAGRHVLVEKPAARSAAELEPVARLAGRRGVVVRVGYNHRFHPAARKARELLESGACGPLMFVRARYGHGGRKGYEREWRADPAAAGGGELIDQGVHLIDLARWFMREDFAQATGKLVTAYWNMPVEDNAFLTLTSRGGRIAHLHASCTEWKNLFSFEIYCREAKLHLEGLGGSYGVERLYHYRMRPEMGPPETTIYEYPLPDSSWAMEWADFAAAATAAAGGAGATLDDALATLRVVAEAYERCRS